MRSFAGRALHRLRSTSTAQGRSPRLASWHRRIGARNERHTDRCAVRWRRLAAEQGQCRCRPSPGPRQYLHELCRPSPCVACPESSPSAAKCYLPPRRFDAASRAAPSAQIRNHPWPKSRPVDFSILHTSAYSDVSTHQPTRMVGQRPIARTTGLPLIDGLGVE